MPARLRFSALHAPHRKPCSFQHIPQDMFPSSTAVNTVAGECTTVLVRDLCWWEQKPLHLSSKDVGGRIFIERIWGISGNLISEHRVLFHRKWKVTWELRFLGSDDLSSLLLSLFPFVSSPLASFFLIFPRLLRFTQFSREALICHGVVLCQCSRSWEFLCTI